MNTSYEYRIVEAMLRHSEALEQGDDSAAAEALVAALTAATALRTKRHGQVEDMTDVLMRRQRRREAGDP